MRTTLHQWFRSTYAYRPGARAVAVVIALLPSSYQLAAQPVVVGDTMRLTLASARHLALEINPTILADAVERAIAKGRLQQAGAFRFNPSAEALGGAGGNIPEFGISQEIELFGQRAARVASARAGLTAASASVDNSRRIAVGEIDRTFYRLVFQKQRATLAESVLALNQRVSTIAERQLAAGEISRLDYNLAVIELGRSRSRAIVARRERDDVTLDFARLLGLGRGVIPDPVLDSTQHSPLVDSTADGADVRILVERGERMNVDSLVSVALRNRADLAAATAQVEQARADVRVAQREALPNLIARGVSEANADADGRAFRAGLGVSLPIFNRNRGEISARRAATTQSHLRQAASQAAVRTEVAQAVVAYRAAAAEVEILETTVLPSARQNRQLLESAYREGKVGLPVLLLIRNQVIDAELDYWSAWFEEREAFALVAEVTGQNLVGLPKAEAVR